MTFPRIAFIGTPQSAVPSLAALTEIGSVQLVVTRPDRPRGRSGQPQPSPVKAAAGELAIEVYEANRGRDLRPEWFANLDLAVVVAFGVLIPADLLSRPAHGFINVHFSLLPRWRGASPVTAAIVAGDEETGVTIIRLDAGLDTGPILSAAPTPIGARETGGALTVRLATIGAELLATTVPDLVSGRIEAVNQPTTGAAYAPLLTKQDLRFDLDGDPLANSRKVRALAPKPGVRLDVDTGPIRLLAVNPSGDQVERGRLQIIDDRVWLGCGDGSVELLEVQPAGRNPMPASDWARGWRSPPTVRGAEAGRD
ncbi:MAG: methionyl-tRNA formyltransferase [Acidimicrobiia bacterium]